MAIPVHAGCGRILAAAFTAATGLLFASGQALADCVQSGTTVTCTGLDTNGFGNGTQNGYTVSVAPDGLIVVNGTAIWLNNGNVVTNNGAISVGDNSTGIAAAANNTIINNGTISFGANGAGIAVTGGNAITNNGLITGGANGNGIWLNGATGNTIFNSGTISAGPSGFAIEGSTSLNTTFINSGNVIGGSNAGAVVLTDNNTITNSGLILGGDNTTGAGQPKALQFNDNNTITNSGTIKAGRKGATGSYAVYGNDNNTLANTGTIDGAIYLHLNNTLTNSGLITTTDPTQQFGSAFTIGGTFTQTAAGTLGLRVDSAGNVDQLAATTANLGGTLRALVQPGLYGATTSYSSVVAATTLNGQFAQVSSSSPFFNATATYNATSVDLTLTRYGFGSAPGETHNQQQVGAALEAGYSTGLTGALATFYGNLLAATSTGVLDQLSGEGTTGVQNTAFLAGALFNTTLTQQMDAWRSGNRAGIPADGAPLGYAAEKTHPAQPILAMVTKAPPVHAPTWNAWGSAFGATQSLKGDASTGSADLDDRAVGGAVGFDVMVGPDLLVGLGVGGSSSHFDVSDRATSGSLDGGHVGAFAMRRWGSAYLAGLISYAHFNNETTRTIGGVGTSETATGSFSSNPLGARLEVGNTWTYGQTNVTPFAAIQMSRLWQDGYTEASTTATGAPGILGLTYQSVVVDSVPLSLGAQFDGRLAVASGMLSPYLRAAWVHEFRPARTIDAAFTSIPAQPFTVDGARAAGDVAKIDAGARLALNSRAGVFAGFNGEFSSAGQTYGGTGGLRISW